MSDKPPEKVDEKPNFIDLWHYLPEECPGELAQRILTFLGDTPCLEEVA
ncbi:MAG TPA: hypothetical protein VK775_13845 [Chthoniobacterales bacterium]|jgi:hypothetical protein|nr:hypothetical protein [Chthoniobacterales bacterium]